MTTTMTLAPGEYVLCYVSEATLAGTRSGYFWGLFANESSYEKLSDYPEPAATFLKYLFNNVDAHITPAAATFSSVETDYGIVTFRGDDDMGNNHNGWTDGCFILPRALWDAATEVNLTNDLGMEADPVFLTVSEHLVLSAANVDEDTPAEIFNLWCDARFPFLINDEIVAWDVEYPGFTIC